jgi:hypothetical protein
MKHDEAVAAILKEKMDLEKKGLKPRVILLGDELYKMIEDEWIESIRELPWGDSLAYEMERKREIGKHVFLGDGSMFGLWVIKVDSISGFKVY